MDEIRIKKLHIFAHHGVFDYEKTKGQNFDVNVTLFLDTRKAGREDDLDKSVNYGEVSELVSRCMTEKTFHLLEAACEYIAYQILTTYSKVHEVEIEICKPEAPISIPFENVSVCIRRKWHKAYIAVGSNMGESNQILEHAAKILESSENHILRKSPIIVTKPYGYKDQDDFLNGMWIIKTLLSPDELLNRLHEIENDGGRVRTIHWGPRTLDMDIIYYDDLVMENDQLTIPHADMSNRLFVLEPLRQVDPYKRHPISHLNADEMIARLDN